MKTAQIVAAGRKHLTAKIKEYIESNPPREKKDGPNEPPAIWERKVVNEFLGRYNLHEAFVEEILHAAEKD